MAHKTREKENKFYLICYEEVSYIETSFTLI